MANDVSKTVGKLKVVVGNTRMKTL